MRSRVDRTRQPLQQFLTHPIVARYLDDPLYRAIIMARTSTKAAAIERCRQHHGEKNYREFVDWMRAAVGLPPLSQ